MKRSTAVLLLVSVVVIAYLLSLVNLKAVEVALIGAQPWFLVVAIAFATLSLLLRTLRWMILLRDKHEISFRTVLAVQSVGLTLSNLSPGKLLEPVKVVPLKKYGISYSFGLFSVFWERAFDLVVIFAMTLLVIPFLSGLEQQLVYLGFGVLLLAVVVMFYYYAWVIKTLSKIPFLKFLANVAGHDFKKRTLLASLLVTALAWVSDSTALLFILKALGMQAQLMVVMSAWCASVLVGVVSFLPGGLGSTEAAMVYLLKDPARPVSLLVAAALLARVILVGPTFLAGLLYLPKIKADSEGLNLNLEGSPVK